MCVGLVGFAPAHPPYKDRLEHSPLSRPVRFQVLYDDPAGAARRGRLFTPHGVVETPAFMPVGTHAGFRHHAIDDVVASGAKILLSNTYHLLLRPGPDDTWRRPEMAAPI